jgi:tetratricopeptide (TPR) repeat protein
MGRASVGIRSTRIGFVRGQRINPPTSGIVLLAWIAIASPLAAGEVAPELPPLILRQPAVVHDAWRQIAAAVAENDRLPRPQPDPYFARAELWMMVGNYDAALRDLLLAMRIAGEGNAAPRVYDSIFNRLREVLERYDVTPVPPEDGEPARHYGHGSHAFWSGCYVDAEKAFSDAISLAPGNPLYWYMRAIARRRLGDEQGAKHDALLGAAAERRACSKRDGAAMDINRGLRRLQGGDRIWLEDLRRGDPVRRTMSGTKS